jgi:hypothetical protein
LEEVEALMDTNLEEIKSCTGATEACLEKRESNIETLEAVAEHQEVPKEKAAMETNRSTGRLVWGQAAGRGTTKIIEKPDPKRCFTRST